MTRKVLNIPIFVDSFPSGNVDCYNDHNYQPGHNVTEVCEGHMGGGSDLAVSLAARVPSCPPAAKPVYSGMLSRS